MKSFRQLIWLLIVVFGIGLTGCAFIHTKTPFDTNLDRTELGTKVGTSDTYSLLWLVAWGDASYAAAARNGGLKILRGADMETTSVLLGLFTHIRVIVYGD
jgi:hypothetical protein